MKTKGFSMGSFLVKNLGLFVLLLHWMGNFWFYIANRIAPPDKSERDNSNTWIPSNYHIIADASDMDEDALAAEFFEDDNSRSITYFFSFYSMLMCTLGGEISP